MRDAADRALSFERRTGEFALGTCGSCMETRLSAKYRKGRGGEKIFARRYADNHGIFTEKNNAIPARRDAHGMVRYDTPCALAGLTLAEKLLIARLSVTVAIHRLAHGGVASAGRVATFPKPVGPMAEVLPRLPSDVTIARARRGATSGDAKKQSRMYTARRKKAMGALYWLKGITRTTMTSR